MSDTDRSSDEPGLFDLPLRPEDEDDGEPEKTEAPPTSRRRSADRDLPLFPEADELIAQEPPPKAVPKSERPRPVPVPEPKPAPEPEETDTSTHEVETPAAAPRRATPARRWLGGGLDLLALVGVGVILALGAVALGGRVEGADLLPLALFLLLFSFVYTVIPLAFWGRTPGMIRAGLVARSGTSDPLTFGQTALRWLGGLLTVAALGLPTLLVLFGGRSLTDRLSGSDTYQDPK